LSAGAGVRDGAGISVAGGAGATAGMPNWVARRTRPDCVNGRKRDVDAAPVGSSVAASGGFVGA
jgi:hypothetical protein